MRPALATLTAACALMAAPLSGQSRASPEELIVADSGVPMRFVAKRGQLLAVLKSKLCPGGRRVLEHKERTDGSLLRCPTIDPPSSTSMFHTIFFFLPDNREQALPWALVDLQADPHSEINVRIGVQLVRGGTIIRSPRGHFFQPGPWAESVWKALDATF
jgi:hypothetical protein